MIATDGQAVPGFWRWAAEHPDDVAAVDIDGTESTYGQLGARVNQIGRWLRDLGIGSAAGIDGDGDDVAVLARNRVDFLAVVLAAGQIGTRFVLVNSHLTAGEVAYILGDAGVSLLITDGEVADTATKAAAEAGLPSDRVVSLTASSGLTTIDDAIAGYETAPPPDRSGGVAMLYTSGTSGRPKGVRVAVTTHSPEEAAGNYTRLLQRFGLDAESNIGDGTHLVTSPLYHAAPIAFSLKSMHLGHRVVVMPRFDAVRSLELIEQHRVTSTHVVPTMMKRWLDLDDDVRRRADVSSMRWLFHAAAPCPVDVKRRIIEWFGPVVYEYYASTEAGGTSIRSDDWLQHPGSVGRPWPGADVKIFGDDGAELPAGEVGQIYLFNARPFEYHGDAEKTAAGRRGDYVTVGDLGYLDDDGYLYLADRRTDLIISGGVNIYPAEIEAALLLHPAVADAAVIGVPDADLGQRVHAVVEPRGAPDDLTGELARHCGANLAGYKQPRTFEVRPSLPRNEAGKLLRRALRDEYDRPVDASTATGGATDGADR